MGIFWMPPTPTPTPWEWGDQKQPLNVNPAGNLLELLFLMEQGKAKSRLLTPRREGNRTMATLKLTLLTIKEH